MRNTKHPILVGLLLMILGFGLAYIFGNVLHLPISPFLKEFLGLISGTIAAVGAGTIFLHFMNTSKK